MTDTEKIKLIDKMITSCMEHDETESCYIVLANMICEVIDFGGDDNG